MTTTLAEQNHRPFRDKISVGLAFLVLQVPALLKKRWNMFKHRLPQPVVHYLQDWASPFAFFRLLASWFLTAVLFAFSLKAYAFVLAHNYTPDLANLAYASCLMLGFLAIQFGFPRWAHTPYAGVEAGILLGVLVHFW